MNDQEFFYLNEAARAFIELDPSWRTQVRRREMRKLSVLIEKGWLSLDENALRWSLTENGRDALEAEKAKRRAAIVPNVSVGDDW